MHRADEQWPRDRPVVHAGECEASGCSVGVRRPRRFASNALMHRAHAEPHEHHNDSELENLRDNAGHFELQDHQQSTGHEQRQRMADTQQAPSHAACALLRLPVMSVEIAAR